MAANGKVSGHSMDGGHVKDADGGAASDGADEDNWPVLALAWDKKMLIAQLLKSELRIVGQWDLDSPAVGVVWLEEQVWLPLHPFLY
jgi:hypothetical protein